MCSSDLFMSQRGFTLIELLIVVAIIAILAAIAVPNFLEAQTRAKVSRVMSDQRTLATALESYKVDTAKYPLDFHEWAGPPINIFNVDLITVRWVLVPLTTPVSYLASLPGTSFPSKGSRYGGNFDAKPDSGSTYDRPIFALGGQEKFLGWYQAAEWNLRDAGPDMEWNNTHIVRYDPTNGTISIGDIFRWGP